MKKLFIETLQIVTSQQGNFLGKKFTFLLADILTTEQLKSQ